MRSYDGFADYANKPSVSLVSSKEEDVPATMILCVAAMSNMDVKCYTTRVRYLGMQTERKGTHDEEMTLADVFALVHLQEMRTEIF